MTLKKNVTIHSIMVMSVLLNADPEFRVPAALCQSMAGNSVYRGEVDSGRQHDGSIGW